MGSPIFDATFRTGRFRHEEPMTTDPTTSPSPKPQDVREAFDSWRQENAAVLREPIIVSLLYDLNRLPEVILTFNYDPDMVRQTVLIVEHFKQWKEQQAALAQSDAGPP